MFNITFISLCIFGLVYASFTFESNVRFDSSIVQSSIQIIGIRFHYLFPQPSETWSGLQEDPVPYYWVPLDWRKIVYR